MSEKIFSEPWSPNWAPHVSGKWTERVIVDDEIEPSVVVMVCDLCKAEHKAICRTGNVKGWINRYASVHLHGDPLDPARVHAMAEAAKRSREG